MSNFVTVLCLACLVGVGLAADFLSMDRVETAVLRFSHADLEHLIE
jgi:hypothetical protein